MIMRHLLATVLTSGLMLSAGAASLSAQDAYPSPLPATDTGVLSQQTLPEQSPSAANPVLWQQYQALQLGVPTNGCQACGGTADSPYNRCGCNTELFPWIDGPGNCDQWCVGPKWEVQADGLILFREDANLNGVIASIGGTTSFVDQFDHGIGGRMFLTGYNDSGYGLQVGWEGVDSWNANVTFDSVGGVTRTIDYNSRLNSIEINFLPHVPYAWKVYSGFRYVELAENFINAGINDKPIPAPVAVPVSTPYTDTTVSQLLKNRLIGYQFGSRRDAWHLGSRLTVEAFINAGVYHNNFRRDDVTQIDNVIITGDDIDTADDEFSMTTSTVRTRVRTNPTDISFLGEAGINSTLKITQCVALRSGYQILAIDGIGQGVDAFFASGLNSSTLVYHGLQFGIEYRR